MLSRGTGQNRARPKRKKRLRVVEEDGAFQAGPGFVFDPDIMAVRPGFGQNAAPKRKPKKDSDPVGSFLGFAGRAIRKVGDIDLPALAPGSNVRPGNQFGGRMRSQKVKGAKVKHAAEAVGEYSGVLPAKRIREGKGTWQDWAAVAAIGLPAPLRNATRAARRGPKFGILSEPAIEAGVRGGKFQVRAKKPLSFVEDMEMGGMGYSPEIGEMHRKFPLYEGPSKNTRPGAYRVEGNPDVRPLDRGFTNRAPVVSAKKGDKGQVWMGQPGWSHGQLIERLNDLGHNYNYGDMYQSFVFQPSDDIIQMMLDFGTYAGDPVPGKTYGYNQLARRGFEAYDDADLLSPNMQAAEAANVADYEDELTQRLIDTMRAKQGPRFDALMERLGSVQSIDPMEEFKRAERHRRKRRR